MGNVGKIMSEYPRQWSSRTSVEVAEERTGLGQIRGKRGQKLKETDEDEVVRDSIWEADTDNYTMLEVEY